MFKTPSDLGSGTPLGGGGSGGSEGQETRGASFLYRFREFFEACYLFAKPVVVAVDGPALAGGFDLALMGDYQSYVAERLG